MRLFLLYGVCSALLLNVVNIDLLAAGSSIITTLRVTVLVELESAVAVLLATESICLVDLGCLGELAVGFEGTGFVGGVLEAIVSR